MTAETQPPTAYLDLHIVTPDISLPDFYDDGDLRPDLPDDFRRKIEQKVKIAVAYELGVYFDNVSAESEWYEHGWPCSELVGYPEKTKCGEPTTRRHERYGRERGVYRVCGHDHKTPVDPIAEAEAARRPR